MAISFWSNVYDMKTKPAVIIDIEAVDARRMS